MDKENINQPPTSVNKRWKIAAIALAVLSVVLVGLSVFLMFQESPSTNNLSTSENNGSRPVDEINNGDNLNDPPSNDISSQTPPVNYEEYLVLSEIGIKIKTQYATKLTHGYSGFLGAADTYSGGKFVDWAIIGVMDHLIDSPNCDVGIGQIDRLTDLPDQLDVDTKQNTKQIGEYVFRRTSTHGFGECSDSDFQFLKSAYDEVLNMDNWEVL